MVSITNESKVVGAHDIPVLADKTIEEIGDLDLYDGVVIPGGLPGATNLRDNPRVIEVVRIMHRNSKLAAAICAGPIVLEKAGIIEGRKVTSYPGFQDQLSGSIYQEEGVVRDGNIITARGPALAVYFAIRIVEYFPSARRPENCEIFCSPFWILVNGCMLYPGPNLRLKIPNKALGIFVCIFL